ncbi:uncharacterized protein Bfra_008355 [Botrytis fragariae]|uniref:Uncharacterized protein n=1 Tax=Botrytis fragariae TaxID=1964551 RepID=A0A8H6EI45_9HELO|nr:uncharacterized protein Bfra_008355 [Botrytis fragariae]KAF5873078.1 hypothetical protein Bfra_008355 [Botrytis fragariae]
MDRQRDDSAERSRNRDSRESWREATSMPLPLSPPPATRQNPPGTAATTTASTTTTTTTPAPPQPRLSHHHQHPIPPPIHPPFHPYTPQLHPPVSTPENLFNRRNLPPFTPLPIADLYQPGGTSYAPQSGISGGSTLGAGVGASHTIPVGGAGDMHASGTSSNAGFPSAKGRYTLPKRESNGKASATASKPYVVKPKSKSSGVKSSRVSKSKKASESSGTATPAAEDLNTYVDTIIDTLTGTIADLNGVAQGIRNVRIEEERRIQARAAAAAAAGERGDLADEEEEEEEEEN